MILKSFNNLLFSLTAFLAISTPAQATVVRMDIAIGDQSTGEIYIELYDEMAPVTVDNFLNYIDDGNGNRRYDGTFFHRSVDVGIDIIQGGGYIYSNTDGATDFVTDGPIINEYNPARPSDRGTIAMARTDVLDSATSQWFINVLDNSLPDYAVFGHVLSNGMGTVDAIALLPTDNLGGPFTDLPTVNYMGEPLLESNLVVLTQVTASPYPPPLFVDPAPHDFGLVVQNIGPVQQTVILRNVGDSPLTLGAIDGAGALDGTPFTIDTGNPGDCVTGQELAPFSTGCTFTALFNPQTLGTFQNSFDIAFDDGSARSINYEVSGFREAALVLPNPDSGDALNIGDTVIGSLITRESDIGGVPFGNQGPDPLDFLDFDSTDSSFRITGTDANDFGVTDNTCETVQPDGYCLINITFNPSSAGVKSAVLEIRTNDPDRPIATLPLTATASSDSDGVADAIEAAGPNNGDGNLDGIPDILQENVTSLPGANGGYVTLESDVGTRLTRVAAGPNPSSGPLPTAEDASLRFPNGFFYFAIEDVPIGGSTTVTLYLPEGQAAANTYFKYGHWVRSPSGYQYSPQLWFWDVFDFDPQTQTGAEFHANRIILHYVDGRRGDNDGQANGIIEDPGGPAIASPDGSSASGGGGCGLLISPRRAGIPIDFVLLLLGLLLKRTSCKPRGV